MVSEDVEKGTSKIEFRVPKLEELDFRKRLYSDLETMDYGDNPFDFTEDKWSAWFDKWMKNPKGRFYAYLIEKATGEPVGDINYHHDEKFKEVLIGVVVMGRFRGRGYGEEGLRLLCQKAKEDGISKICNLIPRDRTSAIQLHKKLGFVEICEQSDKCVVFLEKLL